MRVREPEARSERNSEEDEVALSLSLSPSLDIQFQSDSLRASSLESVTKVRFATRTNEADRFRPLPLGRGCVLKVHERR